MRLIYLIPILCILVSCAGQSETEQTLVAENQVLSTQIADVRNTATVAADRVQITVEHSQTEARHVDDQNVNLIATLVARGTPTEAIGGITPQVVTALPTQPAAQAPGTTVTQEALVQDSSPVAGAAPTTAATATVIGPPVLSSIVTASSVDNNDCALDVTSTFASDTERIYVVAVAANLQPGSTVVTSRWKLEGTEVISYDFTPDFSDGCLWFFADQSDVTFTPGNWSVELEINGGPVGAPVPFTIVDAAAGQ